MRNSWIAVGLLLLAPVAASAQERTARNGLYVELGGSAGIWSLNYERFVTDDVSLRVGGSYTSVTDSFSTSVSLATFPLTASYLGVRSGSHALELGAGVVFASASVSTTSVGVEAFGSGVIGTAILGYRLAPLDGGFNLRVAVTPLFGEGGFFFWGGVALGGLF
ncbi:MAG TPA: hypothetical protein VFI16_07535 [Anaeromyxobacteraceae bacterium]|nr:hypothetical protein [Anaeromyxobacteraceae bacterium]